MDSSNGVKTHCSSTNDTAKAFPFHCCLHSNGGSNDAAIDSMAQAATAGTHYFIDADYGLGCSFEIHPDRRTDANCAAQTDTSMTDSHFSEPLLSLLE